MLLVDISIWSDHLRNDDDTIAQPLQSGSVSMHPFVTGEIAVASFRDGPRRRPSGQGVGFIDIHLLASALLARAALWTRDRRSASAAVALGLAPAI